MAQSNCSLTVRQKLTWRSSKLLNLVAVIVYGRAQSEIPRETDSHTTLLCHVTQLERSDRIVLSTRSSWPDVGVCAVLRRTLHFNFTSFQALSQKCVERYILLNAREKCLFLPYYSMRSDKYFEFPAPTGLLRMCSERKRCSERQV